MQGKKAKKKDIKGHLYPYLSINQSNRVQNNRQCDPYASLDCLNIKLDKKGDMRQTQFNTFKSKVLGSLTRNSRESLSITQEKQQLPRILMKKTLMNPQQLLQATAKVHKQVHRQDSIGHRRRISSNECKKKIILKGQLKETDHNITTIIPKHFSFHNSNATQSTKTRPKKHFFKKMLKKCDKLIQISKFESQLIRNVQSEENALRIHSEPVTLVEYKVDYHDKINDNRRIDRINIMHINQQLEQMKMKPQDFIQNRTIQIRNYSHQIDKMRNMFRKQLTRHQLNLPKKNNPSLEKRKSSKKNQIFGPWESINQSFCISRD